MADVRRIGRAGWCIGTTEEEAAGGSLRLCGWWLENDDTIDKTEKSGENICGEEEGKFNLGEVEFEEAVADDLEAGCGAETPETESWNT